MRTLIASAPEAIQSVTPTTAPEAKQATVTRSRAAQAHTIVARALLGGVALQIFFAGLGVFNVSSFLPHMVLGTLVILGSLALPLIAWRGHLDAALTHRSWLLFALMILQGLLIDVGRLFPLVAAFHPLNAMLLVLLAASMARLTSSTNIASAR